VSLTLKQLIERWSFTGWENYTESLWFFLYPKCSNALKVQVF